jgi:hypothetical protein
VTFTLHIDVDRWRAHQDAVLAELPGLVPVVKGGGYGFGVARLGREAARAGAGCVAVGVPEEVVDVRAGYDGDVLVLTPWHPAWASSWTGPDGPLTDDPRLVRTVSHLEALRALAEQASRSGTRARVVLEVETSMRRHGLRREELPAAAALLDAVALEGVALHLPLAGDHRAEAAELARAVAAAGIPVRTLWVSHLDGPAGAELAAATGAQVRPRVGTRLWLGDRRAYRATGTVLDARPLAKGDRYGYRQRKASTAGTLLVVSGGTAHGVALEAPAALSSARQRAQVLALGGLEAVGRVLSPFTVAGRKRWFAEPPHMQVSLVLLPAGVEAPPLGAEVECEVRMTTVRFDRVVEA